MDEEERVWPTARKVYDQAIYLIDSQGDSSGETLIADNRDYENRTPELLNTVLDHVYPVSDNYPDWVDGRRPVLPKISTLSDPVMLDDRICMTIVSYELAALLISEENPTLANFFHQIFEERLAKLERAGRPATIDAVEDVYSCNGDTTFGMGVIEHGRFGRWL